MVKNSTKSLISFCSTCSIIFLISFLFTNIFSYYMYNVMESQKIFTNDYYHYFKPSLSLIVFSFIIFLIALYLFIKYFDKKSYFLKSFGVFILFSLILYFSKLTILFYILCAAWIIYCFISKKESGTHALIYIIGLQITLLLSTLYPMSYINNVSHYANHLRIIGKPLYFTNLNTCKNSSIWYVKNILPVKEPCFYSAYLNNQKLSFTKTRFISMLYGEIGSYKLFVTGKRFDFIKNYTTKYAIYFYQSYYKALSMRNNNSEKYSNMKLKVRNKILQNDKKYYEKSITMKPSNFISLIKKIPADKRTQMQSLLLASLPGNQNKNITKTVSMNSIYKLKGEVEMCLISGCKFKIKTKLDYKLLSTPPQLIIKQI